MGLGERLPDSGWETPSLGITRLAFFASLSLAAVPQTLSIKGRPRCSTWGVLMWFAASLNSHGSRPGARNVSLISFFQLCRYFKGVVKAYEIKKISNIFQKNKHTLLY